MAFSRSDSAGWTGTNMNAIAEKVISDKTMVAMLEESPLNKIADTNPISELSAGGTTIKFKRYGRPTVLPYSANTNITYGRQTADEVTLELDKAFYGAMRLDDLDKQAIANVDTEHLGRWAKMMKEEHDDNEALEAWTAIFAKVQDTAVMATPKSLDGLFYKFDVGASGVNIKTASEKRDPAAGGRYVLAPFRAGQIKWTRTNLKGNSPYALVSPEMFDMLEFMEDRRQDASGEGYADAITRDTAGNMVVRGFQIIKWNKIDAQTISTITGVHPIVFGSKAGFTAGRVIDKTESGRFEGQFGDYVRQLVAFGAAIWDTRHFGVDYLKLA